MKTTLTFILFMALTVAAMAQPGLPPAPDLAPVDGGLSLLAAAGGLYAASKLRRKSAD